MRFKMSVSYRKKTINEIAKEPTAPVKPAAPVSVDFYGEDVFNTEAHVLREIGYGESCVIAGRSAFFVLKAHPNHISILIQAPMRKRVERVMEKQGITREQAEADIHKVDKWRENYVKKYAGTSRYDTRNYDLVINMAELDEDDAVEIILDYINKSK